MTDFFRYLLHWCCILGLCRN